MPILLTPPDDEVGIGIPNYVIIDKGYLYYFIIMAHLPMFYIRLCHLMTMSTYYFEAMSSMTMLISDPHIQFQFILFKPFFPPIFYFDYF